MPNIKTGQRLPFSFSRCSVSVDFSEFSPTQTLGTTRAVVKHAWLKSSLQNRVADLVNGFSD